MGEAINESPNFELKVIESEAAFFSAIGQTGAPCSLVSSAPVVNNKTATECAMGSVQFNLLNPVSEVPPILKCLAPDGRLSVCAVHGQAANPADEFGRRLNDWQGVAVLPNVQPVHRARRASGTDSKSGASDMQNSGNKVHNKHKGIPSHILATYTDNSIERGHFIKRTFIGRGWAPTHFF